MEQLTELLQSEVFETILTIAGIIFGAFATGLVKAINNKSAEYAAKTAKEDYETQQEIARTVVKAAEQIFGALKGREKFDYAFQELRRQANNAGIDFDDEQVEALLESAVKDLKEVDKAIDKAIGNEVENIEIKIEKPEDNLKNIKDDTK